MGWNTTLMVLNDRWHEAVNNPILFVESIEMAMRSGTNSEAVFQTQVMKSHHADDAHLYLVGGNLITDLYTASAGDVACAEQLVAWRKKNLQ